MRKVMYREWIPGAYANVPENKEMFNPKPVYVEGTNIFSEEKQGLLHGFWTEDVEGERTIVALIERGDGTLVRVLTDNVRFLKI